MKVLLSVREVAETLGVGASTTKFLIRTGAIDSITIGDRRLVEVSALETYLASRRAAAAN